MSLKSLPIFCLFFFFWAALTAWCAPPNIDRLQEAEKLYSQSEWAKAAEAYREIAKAEPDLPANFYFNLGAAALKAGAVAEASVYFWRAHLSSPFSTAAGSGLDLAKTPADASSVRPATWFSWWPDDLRSWPWQIWFAASLACLAPFLWQTTRKKADAVAWSLCGLALLTGALGALHYWQDRMPAAGLIVSAKVQSGPGATFPQITSLATGALVNVEETRQGWLKIRYLSPAKEEAVGWIESPTALRLR